MIITITNHIQESLAKHYLNYELSGDSDSKDFLIKTSDAMLIIKVLESGVYISGMYNQKIPTNQCSRLRELCKTLNSSASYTYSIQSGHLMCLKHFSREEVVNTPDIVHHELVTICDKLTNFYVTYTDVPTPSFQTGRLRAKSMSSTSLKRRLEAVSASVTEVLKELENVKDELENYKNLLEEKAQAARERADSYSTWNDRAEDRASELEDKFTDIEVFYDEIDSAYDELFHAEMTLSIAVMGAHVLD